MISTQKITDLCCVVNAFDSYCADYVDYTNKNRVKECERQKKSITDCIINEAKTLYAYGVTLRKLSNALKKGGWDDNYFIRENGKLVIKYKT